MQHAGLQVVLADAADERVRRRYEEVVRERTESFDEHEQPKEVLPLAAEFTVEGGELTPTMKVSSTTFSALVRRTAI